jgi:phosphosulfolactate phosphohydrolase-like enzyme
VQDAKENQFNKAVGISQHKEEEDRLNRRTCYEDVKFAITRVSVELKCVFAFCG